MDSLTPINTRALLSWYKDNARDLPWRRSKDPYAIWISEVMLQQTRVETVVPYYQRWMQTLPSVGDLAGADEDLVLSLWEGLGYYNRARNLHKAAKQVVNQHQGALPQDPHNLKKLPGIGKYTAAAVSSIAFGKDVAALDGNIRRVLTRLFNIKSPIGISQTEKLLWEVVQDNLPAGKAGTYNQALMELGALVCTPSSPKCELCPLLENCQAYQEGVQEERPVRKAKAPIPHVQVTAAVFQKDHKVLLAKRPPGGLLGGMWEFPGGKQEEKESLPETLAREILEELQVQISVGEKIGVYQHAYTHYRVTLHAFCCSLQSEEFQPTYHTALDWVPISSLPDYPMGKLDRLISKEISRWTLPHQE